MDTTECCKKSVNKVWLNSPTTRGPELKCVMEAYEFNWVFIVGTNINEVECLTCEKIGCKYFVALSTGTATLHMVMKLTGIKCGDKVSYSDLAFGATMNPVVYEGGIPVFVDTEYDTWDMDPVALRRMFEIYPDIKVVVVAHLYGAPGRVDEIESVCDKHGTVVVEDVAESPGATYKGIRTGNSGMYNCISYSGGKTITGSSGGMLLTDDLDAVNRMRKWSTQIRENAPWYQYEELGYNYRMSNLIAGAVRGQYPYLEEHIKQKKEVYERYEKGLSGLPVRVNPYDSDKPEPDFWLSCMLIGEVAMCRQVRGEKEALYISQSGKSCSTEVLENLSKYDAKDRPIWEPMHM